MINLVLWLVFGGLIGFLAGSVLGTNDSRQRLGFNVAVGMAGALTGGFLFGASTINSSVFSFGALLISFFGAVIVTVLANFFRRTMVR